MRSTVPFSLIWPPFRMMVSSAVKTGIGRFKFTTPIGASPLDSRFFFKPSLRAVIFGWYFSSGFAAIYFANNASISYMTLGHVYVIRAMLVPGPDPTRIKSPFVAPPGKA